MQNVGSLFGDVQAIAECAKASISIGGFGLKQRRWLTERQSDAAFIDSSDDVLIKQNASGLEGQFRLGHYNFWVHLLLMVQIRFRLKALSLFFPKCIAFLLGQGFVTTSFFYGKTAFVVI